LFSKIYSLAENIELTEISDSEKVTLVFYNQCFSRNRRYAFAYYEHRLSKIRNLRWETGAVLPSQIRAKLSSRENDYFIEYNNILTDYCNELTLDLTTDLQVLSHWDSPVSPSLALSVHLFSLCPLTHSLCLSLDFSVCLLTSLSVCLSLSLSVCLSLSLSLSLSLPAASNRSLY
jgi:hypothetical protein